MYWCLLMLVSMDSMDQYHYSYHYLINLLILTSLMLTSINQWLFKYNNCHCRDRRLVFTDQRSIWLWSYVPYIKFLIHWFFLLRNIEMTEFSYISFFLCCILPGRFKATWPPFWISWKQIMTEESDRIMVVSFHIYTIVHESMSDKYGYKNYW